MSSKTCATLPIIEILEYDDDTLRIIAEAYYIEGNEKHQKKEFGNAIKLYTEGIKVSCQDDEMNAKLYNSRATAHFHLGVLRTMSGKFAGSNYYAALNQASLPAEGFNFTIQF